MDESAAAEEVALLPCSLMISANAGMRLVRGTGRLEVRKLPHH